MKRFKSIVVAALVMVVAVSGVLPAAGASAQSQALSINPKKTYTIEPGKSVSDTLLIKNLDKSNKLDLNLRVVDFTFTDDGGSPKLQLDPNAEQTTWSLKPYMSMPKTVSIPADSSRTVDFKVAMPKNIGGGSYYSAIVYSSGQTGEGNVGLNASGVTLVFADVPGDVKQDLKVEKFGAYGAVNPGQKPDYMFLTMNEPKEMAYTLKNNGNVAESPAGSITLKSMFGQEYTITEVNPNESKALIGQSRTFTSCIKLKEQQVDFEGDRTDAKTCVSAGLWPGYYGASLDLFSVRNGKEAIELHDTASFWYLPLWFIIIVLVLLVAIGLGIWWLVRKVRGESGGSHSGKKHRRK